MRRGQMYTRDFELRLNGKPARARLADRRSSFIFSLFISLDIFIWYGELILQITFVFVHDNFEYTIFKIQNRLSGTQLVYKLSS